jgi:hypothetical protein
MLRPLAPIDEIIQTQGELRKYIAAALTEGRDYGTIPGVDKPSLLKPGAERINTAYGVMPRFTIERQEVDHHMEVQWRKRKKVYGSRDEPPRWEEQTGTSLGLYAYTVRCELIERNTGVMVADCIGVCSSMESKYIDRPRDSQNTVLKMAEKRAYVGATLLAYGLSDQFTQDVEETGTGAEDSETGSAGTGTSAAPRCPLCSGAMWDNRQGKTNPRAPDFKCRDKNCKGVIWPSEKQKAAKAKPAVSTDLSEPLPASVTAPDADDQLPF